MKDLEITPRKTNKKDIDDRKEEIQGQDFVKLKNRDGTKNNSMKQVLMFKNINKYVMALKANQLERSAVECQLFIYRT